MGIWKGFAISAYPFVYIGLGSPQGGQTCETLCLRLFCFPAIYIYILYCCADNITHGYCTCDYHQVPPPPPYLLGCGPLGLALAKTRAHLDFASVFPERTPTPKGLRINVRCSALLSNLTDVQDQFENNNNKQTTPAQPKKAM